MSISYTRSVIMKRGNAVLSSTSDTASGDAEVTFNGTIPGGTAYAANEIDVAFDYTKIKSIVIVADGALGLKTNASDGTAAQTFALAAGIPIQWDANDTGTCPITASVTKMYADPPGSDAVNLKIYVLVDATP